MAKKKEIREKDRRATEEKKRRGIPADRLEVDDTKRQKENK